MIQWPQGHHAARPPWTLPDGLINDCIFTAASPLKSVTCVVTTDPILMSGKRGLCPVEEFIHGCMLAPTRAAQLSVIHLCMILCVMYRKLCVERLESVRSIYRLGLVSRNTRVEASMRREDPPTAKPPAPRGPPLYARTARACRDSALFPFKL